MLSILISSMRKAILFFLSVARCRPPYTGKFMKKGACKGGPTEGKGLQEKR
jgi:hypothetical protein